MRSNLIIILFGSVMAAHAKAPKIGKVQVVGAQKSFFETELEPILRAIDSGNVTVYDTNCDYGSYSQTRDLAAVRVNAQDFYVVLNSSMINGKTYSASHCEKSDLSDGSSEVECISHEVTPTVVPGSSLSFSMKYRKSAQNPIHYLIYKCPWAGQ